MHKRSNLRTHRGVTVYPKVWEAIRSWIVSCGYPPGARVATDTEFAARLNVSSQTIARAMKLLEHEGFVVRRRGSGTYLANPSTPPFIIGRMIRIGILMRKEIHASTLSSNGFSSMVLQALRRRLNLEHAETEFDQGDGKTSTYGRWHSRERGVEVHLFGEPTVSGLCHPDYDSLAGKRFDILVLLGIIEDEFVESIINLGMSVILVDFPGSRYLSRADSVYVDPLPGFQDAARWLSRKEVRNVHFLGSLVGATPKTLARTPLESAQIRRGSSITDPDSILRLMTARTALEEVGIKLPDACIHFEAFHEGRLVALGRRLANLPDGERPQALLGASNGQICAVAKAFERQEVSLALAGVTHLKEAVPEYIIYVNPEQVAESVETLIRARLLSPNRSCLKVGVVTRGVLCDGHSETEI